MDERIDEIERAIDGLTDEFGRFQVWTVRLLLVNMAVAVLALLATTGTIVGKWTGKTVIKANEFQVVKDGKVMVSIGAAEEGGGILVFGANGKVMANIYVGEGGGTVAVFDRDEKPMVILGVDDDDGHGFVWVNRRKGQTTDTAVGLSVNNRQAGWVYTTDAFGQLNWTTP